MFGCRTAGQSLSSHRSAGRAGVLGSSCPGHRRTREGLECPSRRKTWTIYRGGGPIGRGFVCFRRRPPFLLPPPSPRPREGRAPFPVCTPAARARHSEG